PRRQRPGGRLNAFNVDQMNAFAARCAKCIARERRRSDRSQFDVGVSFAIILPIEEDRYIWSEPYWKLQVPTRSFRAELCLAELVPAQWIAHQIRREYLVDQLVRSQS